VAHDSIVKFHCFLHNQNWHRRKFGYNLPE